MVPGSLIDVSYLVLFCAAMRRPLVGRVVVPVPLEGADAGLRYVPFHTVGLA
jgi:hypothetical protein